MKWTQYVTFLHSLTNTKQPRLRTSNICPTKNLPCVCVQMKSHFCVLISHKVPTNHTWYTLSKSYKRLNPWTYTSNHRSRPWFFNWLRSMGFRPRSSLHKRIRSFKQRNDTIRIYLHNKNKAFITGSEMYACPSSSNWATLALWTSRCSGDRRSTFQKLMNQVRIIS